MSDLPGSSSNSVILATPSDDERIRSWTAFHADFGTGSTLAQYIDRQRAYTQTIPLAINGAVAPWILTTNNSESESEPRPLLSACETIRKRALYRDPSTGAVKDVSAHALSVVFTPIEARRRGYAGRMTSLVSEMLAQQHKTKPEAAQFSYLYSAIGSDFYKKNGGWQAAAENSLLEFDVAGASLEEDSSSGSAVDVTDDMLPGLAARDEELLRAELALPPSDPSKIRMAFCPDMLTLGSMYVREDRVLGRFAGRKPTVRGAVHGQDGKRIWALWMRCRYPAGKDGTPEKYRLHLLRLAMEDRSSLSEDDLVEGLRGVFAVALREAKAWNCDVIDTWNPSEEIREVVQRRLPELGAKMVERHESDIACLRWFGEDCEAKDIDWVANERYAWC